MTSQTNKKEAHHSRPVTPAFENVRQWMTAEELESFLAEENHLGILLSLILLRHRSIRKHIKSLTKIADAEWEERLLRIDESIQVYHFFYQSFLCQYYEDHKKYAGMLSRILKKLEK